MRENPFEDNVVVAEKHDEEAADVGSKDSVA
jgi:hypothetical protein